MSITPQSNLPINSCGAPPLARVQFGTSNFFVALRALQAMECTGLITREQRTCAELELDLLQAANPTRRYVVQLDNAESDQGDGLHLAFLQPTSVKGE